MSLPHVPNELGELWRGVNFLQLHAKYAIHGRAAEQSDRRVRQRGVRSLLTWLQEGVAVGPCHRVRVLALQPRRVGRLREGDRGNAVPWPG